ncbi:MAG: glycogen-binding domain-containing protein [Candidatus Eisenbacteria bacterium]|nr:glycogen-binding domain-containing protein [Candidatus Eisenbacteria bacterium]
MRGDVTHSRSLRFLIAIATVLILAALWTGPSSASLSVTPGGIKFTYTDANAKQVFLAGDFNGWNTSSLPMTKSGDTWSVVAKLAPGQHEYKFFVDGNWVADPDNPVTVGGYGNSGIQIAADGSILEALARTGRNLNSKFNVAGRYLGTYVIQKNLSEGGYFDLIKPDHDIDVDLTVEINENMNAHALTNIHNNAENIESWKTHLNFNRGHMELALPEIYLLAYDNEGTPGFGDSLHVLGDVGIYHHGFGYNTQGLFVKRNFPFGLELSGIYADDSRTGGTARPAYTVLSTNKRNIRSMVSEGSTVLLWSAYANRAAENIGGVRLTRHFGDKFVVGGLYRNDRGFNFGSLTEMTYHTDTTAATDAEKLVGQGTGYEVIMGSEALGWDAYLKVGKAMRFFGEYAEGTSRINAQRKYAISKAVSKPDSSGMTVEIGDYETSRKNWTYDSSARWIFGCELGVSADASFMVSVESEKHSFNDFALDGFTATPSLSPNPDSIPAVSSSRLGAKVRTSLKVWPFFLELSGEEHHFKYDSRSHWGSQMWFDYVNFWLDEHILSYDKMTLLGGTDALILKPSARLFLDSQSRNWLEYAGTFSGAGFSYRPSYIETLIRSKFWFSRTLSLYNDARFASYNHKGLSLKKSFFSNFVELGLEWSKQVRLEFGFGVDPYVLDEVLNEYTYIGRDMFLFGKSADAMTAVTNYKNIGKIIEDAENSMSRERRISVEAKLRF